MSGHSKWATTKHKKAVVDAKRGKLFAKLIKNVEVAARTGGGDPAGNPTLYDAIQKAKKSSVPNDNIDRALRRGSGAEAGGAQYETCGRSISRSNCRSSPSTPSAGRPPGPRPSPATGAAGRSTGRTRPPGPRWPPNSQRRPRR